MGTRTGQLQIRVTPSEKATLRRLAAAEGLSLSAFVLARALPDSHEHVNGMVRALGGEAGSHKAMSDLWLYLDQLAPGEFEDVAAAIDVSELTQLQANCAAGAVEGEAWRRDVPHPAWTEGVEPLRRPHFGLDLPSLRPHLMRVSPAPLKRRNVYVALPGDPRL